MRQDDCETMQLVVAYNRTGTTDFEGGERKIEAYRMSP